MRQRKIVGGIRRGFLDRENISVYMLNLIKVWNGIISVSRRGSYVQNNTVVGVYSLMRQIVRFPKLLRAVHMPCLRIASADMLLRLPSVVLDLFRPLGAPLSRAPFQFLQSFLFISIQTVIIGPGFRLDFHQFFRGAGSIGLNVRRICSD